VREGNDEQLVKMNEAWLLGLGIVWSK